MLSKAVSSFWVFGMTRPGNEPRSPGPLANIFFLLKKQSVTFFLKTKLFAQWILFTLSFWLGLVKFNILFLDILFVLLGIVPNSGFIGLNNIYIYIYYIYIYIFLTEYSDSCLNIYNVSPDASLGLLPGFHVEFESLHRTSNRTVYLIHVLIRLTMIGYKR